MYTYKCARLDGANRPTTDNNTPILKPGTEARIKRTNRRRLLLFSDVLLVAEPPLEAGNARERIFVKQARNWCMHVYVCAYVYLL